MGSIKHKYMAKTLGWLVFGLLIQISTFWYSSHSPEITQFTNAHSWGLDALMVGLFLFVFGMVDRVNTVVTASVFILYSGMSGLSEVSFPVGFSGNNLVIGALVMGGLFIANILYGYTTKRNLSAMGGLVYMILIGLLIPMAILMFFKNATLYTVMSFICGLSVIVLIAIEAQGQIKNEEMLATYNAEELTKHSIVGAMTLLSYKFFIYLNMLRILFNISNVRRFRELLAAKRAERMIARG